MKKEQAFLALVKEFCQTSNKKLVINHCTFCNYPVGYYWSKNALCFDSGCPCFRIRQKEYRKEDEILSYIKENFDYLQTVVKPQIIQA